jgi:hypothetical protein
MPLKRIDADKDNHPAEPMQFSFNGKDDFFAAVCPRCEAYALVTPEQAAGNARCFGNLILLSWLKD